MTSEDKRRRMIWGDLPAVGRRESIEPALRRLYRMKSEGSTLVETGTARSVDGRLSDGWSTVALGWFASQTKSRLFTVDVDPQAMMVSKHLSAPYSSAIEYVTADSVAFLDNWDLAIHGPIDFLFLDSVDLHEREKSCRHCLLEARAALPSLADSALVLFDDTTAHAGIAGSHGLLFEGKGSLAIPFLLDHGFRVDASGSRQVMLARGKPSIQDANASDRSFTDATTVQGESSSAHRSGAWQRLRLLWASNAPWVPTGYGVQTALFVPRLMAAGHKVAIHCLFGLEGGEIDWQGLFCLPRGRHPWGQDIMGSHGTRFEADIIIPLVDAWILEPEQISSPMRLVPWFPVDSDPMPSSVRDKVKRCWHRIVFSKFAQAKCEEAGLSSFYVPHGIDTRILRPINRVSSRDALGLPQDAFIVGMVAANRGTPSRKAIPQCLEAFAQFHRRHADAFLYLHTEAGAPMDPLTVHIPALAADLGILDRILLAPPYTLATGFTTEHMARLYSSFDVLLSPSLGEGFGVPILEAQACGCPVIVGDWTSMSELCFSGIKIPKSDAERFRPSIGGFQFVPHIGAIVDALESTWRETTKRPEYSERARMATLAYDAEAVVESYWLPVLDALAREIKNEKQRS